MAKIYQFIDDFLNPAKEALRGEILKNHDTGLTGKVSDQARIKLNTMELELIVPKMYDELDEQERDKVTTCVPSGTTPTGTPAEAVCILSKLLTNRPAGEFIRLVADLETKRFEARELCPDGSRSLATTAVYSADKIHVFGITPKKIRKDVEQDFIVRGNGYDMNDLPRIIFRRSGSTDKEYVPSKIWCDPDLNEYLLVEKVKLPDAGDWKVFAKRRDGMESPDCGDANLVHVV